MNGVRRLGSHAGGLALSLLLAGSDTGSVALMAQGVAPRTGPAAPAQATAQPAADMFGPLKWRNIGPANAGGRVDDVAVARVPGAPDSIYVATASGGVFKSTNQGTSWSPVFDSVEAMMSIGDIAVAPSNPNIVWVGTGEANNRQSSSWGEGVHKSVDGGQSWTHMGLDETRHIGRIVVHPTNADIVYVAAQGHLWGANAERGIFKTVDGGRTWKKVLYVDENTGGNDIAFDPQDPDTLFASTYQRQRKAWGYNGGGPGSGIYRTYDGATTWTKLTGGLPTGVQGRIGLDVFQRDGRIIYATVEAGTRPTPGSGGSGPGDGVTSTEGGVFSSNDRGNTWERLSTLNPRPSYYSQIRIDPRDRSRIYILGSNRGFYISDDGGRNFRDVFSTIHSEDHALWIDPDDPNHLLVGGDGGVSISWDRGATWMFRDNLPIGQFYEIGVDMKDPYTVCGGLQDNGHWCVPSATRNRNGIATSDAFNIGSGDGFHARIDPADPNTVIVESQGGRANRVNLVTLERQAISPVGGEKPKRGQEALRWNWDTPIVLSSADPAVVYMGANILFRSTDRGAAWKAISPDLTAQIDRTKLQLMGVTVTQATLSSHDGQSNYGSLTAVAESPLDPNLLYTGSDDGQLQVTRDGGTHWTNLTSRVTGLPANTYVSSVLPSHFVVARVYATFDAHYNDDYKPYVYVSEDFGQSWKSIVGGLPGTGVNRIREGQTNQRLLFLGHEKGLHVSVDGGESWVPVRGSFPTVPVDDLLIHPRDHDLVVGTHGRSLWILDDIAPFEALTPQALARDESLLPIPTAELLSIYIPQAWYGAGQFFAPNPEFGTAFTYYLRAPAAGDVQIGIKDSGGAVVRTLRSPARQGLNRATWDLRMEPPISNEQERPAVGGFGGSPVGPLVLPGTYGVTLRTPGASRELAGTFAVTGDPRVKFSAEDRRARQAILLDLHELQKTLGAARAAGRAAASQTATLNRDLATAAGEVPSRPPGPTLTLVEKAADRATQVQAELQRQLNVASQLARAIENYSGPPTDDQGRLVNWAFEDATASVEDLNRLVDVDLPALYADLAKQQVWPKRAGPIAPPVRRTPRP